MTPRLLLPRADRLGGAGGARPLRRIALLLLIAGLLSYPGCAPFFSFSPPPPVSELGVRERIELPVDWIAAQPRPEQDAPPERRNETPLSQSFRLALPEAINYGLANSPRLRQATASVGEALGRQQIAHAPYFPTAALEYRFVAAGSEVTGFAGDNLPYTFGFGPGEQEFAQGELQIEWTLIDFGRRASQFRHATLQTDIAAQRRARTCQRVVYEVATAYFQALYTKATRTVAEQSVRRAEAILVDSRNLFERGVTDRDALLRAELQLAESRETLVAARSAEAVARARLNMTMGRNVSTPIELVEPPAAPRFELPLGTCLQWAAEQRREVAIARATVAAAQAALSEAIANFRPRIFAKGAVARIDGSGVLSEDVQAAGLHIRQDLFAGCARVGRQREAAASVAYATAQAQGIFDTIAFEVNQAYEAIFSARQRIELSQSSIAQARENLRQVTDKYNVGDATPTDIVDAETTLTRSQQSYFRALFDYYSALAQMEFAIGAPLATDAEPM